MEDLKEHFTKVRNELRSKLNNFTYKLEPAFLCGIIEPVRFDYQEAELLSNVFNLVNSLKENGKLFGMVDCCYELYAKRNYEIISCRSELLGLIQNNYIDIFSLMEFINYLLMQIQEGEEKEQLIKKISRVFKNKKLKKIKNKSEIYNDIVNKIDTLSYKSKQFGYNVSKFDSKDTLEFKDDYKGYLEDLFKAEAYLFAIQTHIIKSIEDYLITYSNAKIILLEINSYITFSEELFSRETEDFLEHYKFRYEEQD